MDTTVIAVASGNEHKIKEIRQLFPDFEVIPMKQLGFDEEIEENGKSFAENAVIKAGTVSKKLNVCALSDDSGLCVDALGGAPGIYSARYSGKGDGENRRLLLKNLENVSDRRAQFRCAVCLYFPDGKYIIGEGQTSGTITREERGCGGFGYDSLFLSDDLGVTFGEASQVSKNAVSHRFRALCDLRSKL